MTHDLERLIIGFEGVELNSALVDLLADTRAVGVILFARNLESPEQARRLVADLRRSLARPLLVAIDQEEGGVIRLSRGLTVYPGNRVLGRADDLTLTERAARASARQMADLGIDLVLAPVVDLAGLDANPITGNRSFGDDPELVIEQARAYMRGLAAGGCSHALKHFPGLGGVAIDPHHALPTVAPDRDLERDLRPFRSLHSEADAIMTTHVLAPALDAERPATFSEAIVTRLLREQMGFDGVILSDDMIMGGANHEGGLGAAALAALQAGHDAVLICHDEQKIRETATQLREARLRGAIAPDEDAAALRRLDRLLRRAGEDPDADAPRVVCVPGLDDGWTIAGDGVQTGNDEGTSGGDDGTSDGPALAREIASRGLRILGDPRRLALAQSDRLVVLRGLVRPPACPEEGFEDPAAALHRGLAAERADAIPFIEADAIDSLSGFDRLLVPVARIREQEGKAELLRRLQSRFPERVLLLLMGPPSDREFLSPEGLALDLGGARRAQVEAAISFLAGDSFEIG